MSQVSNQVTGIVGVLTTSFFIDRFGRKPVHIIASVLIGVTGILTAYSVNYIMLLFMRALSAILVAVSEMGFEFQNIKDTCVEIFFIKDFKSQICSILYILLIVPYSDWTGHSSVWLGIGNRAV